MSRLPVRARRYVRAVARRAGFSPAGAAPVRGAVEEFSWKLVTGWVAVPPGTPPVRVTLHLGNVTAAGTWAARPGPIGSKGVSADGALEFRPFRFKIRGLWEFARRSTRVTVRVAGQPLPIAGHGMFLRPKRNGAATPAELAKRLAAGHVFSQTGHVQLSRKLDVDWQRAVLDLHERVGVVLRERFGYDPFVIYGSLLGAVREQGFLGHDIDFDAAYVSRHTDGADVAAERQQIALALIDAGFDLEALTTTLHLHSPVDPQIRIDLFHLYFDAAGVLSFPFGVAGTRDVRKEEWGGLTESQFGPARVLVPTCAEAVVEAIYGPTWREPQPGFSWTLDRRTQAHAGRVPGTGSAYLYWANHHAHAAPLPPSPFATALQARVDLPGVVVDLGCGDGRDAVAFAAAGRTVVGLDRCPVGLRRARERVAGAEFRECDLADAAQVRAALTEVLAAAGERPVLFYARFLFHAVPPQVQELVLTELAALARPGDGFAAEFRTLADEALPKNRTPRIGRRYLDGPALGARLVADGWDLLDEVEATGLAPLEKEDPMLYRVVARWTGTP